MSVAALAKLKPGRHNTELGWLPADWDLMSLEALALVTSGKRLPKGTALVDKVTPHPYVRVSDMRHGTVETSDIRYVPEHAAATIKRYRIFTDDIFVSVAGTLGLVGIVPAILNGANLTENADRITQIRCSQRYLMHVLLSPVVQDVIDEVRTVGAQPKLALTRLRKFLIPLPPTKNEQEAIATALSDADALIETLGCLIAKKRQIKEGAMQELLAPRANWVERRLGTSAQLKARIGWQGLTTAEYLDSGSYHLVTGTDFEGGFINWDDCHFVERHRYDQDKYIQLRENDVLVTKDGTIGKVAYIDHLPKPATLNSGVFVIRPLANAFRPMFFYYLLMSPVFEKFLARLSAGSTINHLYQKDFVGFLFLVPATNEEQDEIARTLLDMDHEVQALEVRLAKARQIKQGMMQELLSGRIRLV